MGEYGLIKFSCNRQVCGNNCEMGDEKGKKLKLKEFEVVYVWMTRNIHLFVIESRLNMLNKTRQKTKLTESVKFPFLALTLTTVVVLFIMHILFVQTLQYSFWLQHFLFLVVTESSFRDQGLLVIQLFMSPVCRERHCTC